MSDRPFSHPNFGREIKLKQFSKSVHLIFTASTRAKADELFAELLAQLKAGAVNITIMGKPTSIVDDHDD